MCINFSVQNQRELRKFWMDIRQLTFGVVCSWKFQLIVFKNTLCKNDKSYRKTNYMELKPIVVSTIL